MTVVSPTDFRANMTKFFALATAASASSCGRAKKDWKKYL